MRAVHRLRHRWEQSRTWWRSATLRQLSDGEMEALLTTLEHAPSNRRVGEAYGEGEAAGVSSRPHTWCTPTPCTSHAVHR